MELCINSRTEAAKRYLKYFMHHIDLLRYYKITPVVVFDGGYIPCKSATVHDRHSSSHSIYGASTDSDQEGIAAIITEDSDLMAYGCQVIIFKMNKYGNDEEFVMDKLLNTISGGLSFQKFDKELFAGMCVLAGCDFLPSIPGIGNKELPLSTAAAIAEGHLNPVTMEAYDSISTVEACFSNISTPSPDHINSYESQVQLTEESATISIQESSSVNFAVPDTGNEKLMEAETVVFDEKKYKKDSLALGKLIAPARLDCLVVEDRVDTRGVPNNNPFKKRKPDNDGKEVPDNNPFKKGKLQPCGSVQKECWSEPISVLTTVETSVDMLCSLPGELDSVESKPKKKVPVASMKQEAQDQD